MTPLELVLSALPDARQVGDNQWSAKCPAHDDKTASLSIAEGDGGRAILHCHAKCTPRAICDELGLGMRDLFPGTSTASASAKPRETAKTTEVRRHANGKKLQTYATAEMAIAILERSRGPCSAKWAYHNAQGEVVGWTLRWDKSGGKEILPVSLTADGWIVGGMPTPRPLYRLPELTVARRVYVTEGEKAADAGRALGLVTTCSAHGAQSAKQTDWSRLAGKEVVLLPDNDTAGQQYADTVARILAKLHPAPVIKYVELPDLPPKGDLYDFVATRISEGRN